MSQLTEPQQESLDRPTGTRWQSFLRFLIRDAGVALALVIIVAFFSVAAQYFATVNNFRNLLVQIAINTVLASGMTFVILIGGIDLSVGSILSLATVVGAKVMINKDIALELRIPLAILGCMGVGAIAGFLNGYVSERWKLPAFIVTLGMLNIGQGAARIVSENVMITGLPRSFVEFGDYVIAGVIPNIFLIAIGVVFIGWLILTYTVFGRMIFAIGTNEEAVRLSGHNPVPYKLAAYTLCGLLVGIGGVVYLLRLNVGNPIAGIGYELNAIAAVIIGGTSFSGGKGSIIGTLIGACILQVLTTGLQLLGVGDNFKPIVIGLVIVLAVILDTYRARALRALEMR